MNCYWQIQLICKFYLLYECILLNFFIFFIPVNKKGVFHCCPFNRELVKEALKLGFYISIAGPVTFKNSNNAPEIIDMIPIDRMLIETDSPYLAPEPVRGTRNDSRNVKYTAQKIAELKGLTLEEVAEATYRNAEKLYNIEE
jgi:TatD DNase family protein